MTDRKKEVRFARPKYYLLKRSILPLIGFVIIISYHAQKEGIATVLERDVIPKILLIMLALFVFLLGDVIYKNVY